MHVRGEVLNPGCDSDMVRLPLAELRAFSLDMRVVPPPPDPSSGAEKIMGAPCWCLSSTMGGPNYICVVS